MKRLNLYLSLFIICSFLLSFLSQTSAQRAPRVAASLKSSLSQTLGLDTEITIVYSRPGVKGRKIWGDLVPYGLAPGNQYSDDKPFPWRAGANANTTIEFNNDILVEGQKLAAGKYGIHMIPSENDWTIAYSKNNSSWGSFSYNKDEDALRVTVKPVKAPHQEWLMYGFEDLAGSSGTAYLHWEELKIPVKIKLAE